ncbi:MAG TPA: hypothetical protein VMV19_01890 [Xanthobacteraceae bacterium]|nr:hypothetical protein [Xanthobacteraceae bacterium]
MRPVDSFGIAVAALITLMSPLLVIGSALWWGAISISATIAVYFGGHILWARFRPKSPFPKAYYFRVLAALYLAAFGLWFDAWYYTNMKTNGWYWHAQLIFPSNTESPDVDDIPLDSLPVLSRGDRFIVACAVPPKVKTQFDNRQAFIKTVSDWAPIVGIELGISDIQNGLRLILEAKTPEAKRYFLAINIVKGVTKITVDFRRLGQKLIITAYSDLPKDQQKLTTIIPDPSSPPMVQATTQLSQFLGLSDEACSLI